MAINAVKVNRPGKSGGASVGSVLGGLGALIAAPFTAGASLSFLGPAMTAGGVVGGAVDKGQAASSEPAVKPSAMARRLEQPAEQPQSEILKQSLAALHDSNDDNLRSTYGEPIFNAYNMALKKERGGMA